MGKAARKAQSRLGRRVHRHEVAVAADKIGSGGLNKPGSQNRSKTAPLSKGKRR